MKNKGDDFGWGIVVDYRKEQMTTSKNDSKDGKATELDPTYIVSVLLYVSKASAENKVCLKRCLKLEIDVHSNENLCMTQVVSALKPCGPKEEGEMRVVPCYLNLITKISSVRLYFNDDLRPLDNRMEVYKRMQVNEPIYSVSFLVLINSQLLSLLVLLKEVHRRFPQGVPLLDPIKDMHIKDKEFVEMVQRSRAFEERLGAHPLHSDKKIDSLCQLYHDKLGVSYIAFFCPDVS